MTTSPTRLALFMSLALLCWAIVVAAEDKPPRRDVTEKRLIQIDFSLLLPDLFAVSPDSLHVAYGARAEQKQFVIVDGQAGKPYPAILGGMLRFSPNSQRVAYGAQQDRKSFLVVDGKAHKPYEALGAGTLRFSPDSQHVAYAAVTDARMRVVVDATEHPPYTAIVPETLTFSPNGQRLAYGATSAQTASTSPTAYARDSSGLSCWMDNQGSPTMALALAACSLARTGNAWPMSSRWASSNA